MYVLLKFSEVSGPPFQNFAYATAYVIFYSTDVLIVSIFFIISRKSDSAANSFGPIRTRSASP